MNNNKNRGNKEGIGVETSNNQLAVVYYGTFEQSLDMSARRLVREALTLIEASISDDANQVALKNALKQIIWKNIKNIKNDVEQNSFPLDSVGSDNKLLEVRN